MKSCFVALLLWVLAGCGMLESSDEPDVHLDADHTVYQPGQEVVLTLANASRRTFMVHPHLCGAVLQKWVRAAWVPERYEGVCTDVGFELRPGTEIVSRRPLGDTLSAAEYRYMYALREWEEGDRYRRFEQIELHTHVFQVKP